MNIYTCILTSNEFGYVQHFRPTTTLREMLDNIDEWIKEEYSVADSGDFYNHNKLWDDLVAPGHYKDPHGNRFCFDVVEWPMKLHIG